jgi:hypothetical protein
MTDDDKGRMIINILTNARLAHRRKVENARGPAEMRQIPPYSAGDLFLQLAYMDDAALTALNDTIQRGE